MRLLLCNSLSWAWPAIHRNQWHNAHNFTKINKIVRARSNLSCSLRFHHILDSHSWIRIIRIEPRCSLCAQVVHVATTTISRTQSCDCGRGSRQGTLRSNLSPFKNEERLTLELELTATTSTYLTLSTNLIFHQHPWNWWFSLRKPQDKNSSQIVLRWREFYAKTKDSCVFCFALWRA